MQSFHHEQLGFEQQSVYGHRSEFGISLGVKLGLGSNDDLGGQMMTLRSNKTNLVVEWAVVLVGITVDTTVIFTTAAFKA